MRGERLVEAALQENGIKGDWNIVVVSAAGDRIITARTHPGLLGLQASVSSDGVTLIDELPWHPEQVRLVGTGEHTERFDVLPLLVATDGAIQELDLDLRRLRPNIVIGDVAGQSERSWPGARLRSGEGGHRYSATADALCDDDLRSR